MPYEKTMQQPYPLCVRLCIPWQFARDLLAITMPVPVPGGRRPPTPGRAGY
jgi:hypothetical protein